MDGDAVLAGRAGREDQSRFSVIPDRSARQTSPFRAGKDSADGVAVLSFGWN